MGNSVWSGFFFYALGKDGMLYRMGLDGLDERERVFVEGVVKGKSLAEAYKAAYPKCRAKMETMRRRGQDLMAEERIRRVYESFLEGENRNSVAGRQEVLEYLTAVMRGVRRDAGEDVLGVPVKLADASKAAELLGKRYGLFSEEKRGVATGQVQIVDDIVDGDV